MADMAPTSGNAATASPASGESPPWPKVVSMIQSHRAAWSTLLAIEARAEAPNTVMNTTRPTPIIRADAVADVRLGLRVAFSRAMVPVMPRRRGSGAPSRRLTGRAPTGPSTPTPRNTTAAPMPTMPAPPPLRPMANSAMPAAVTTPPMTARRTERPERSTATSRMAATGATFAARRAGTMAATRVTTVPTATQMATVEPDTTSPPAGRSSPKLSSRARRPTAAPMPSATPRPDANRPVTSASSLVARAIWRRLAPMARSMAVSLVRWATVMEKVFEITNEPTSRAVMAKAMRKVLMNPTASPSVASAAATASSWVRASTWGVERRARDRLRVTSAEDTPGPARTAMAS